jgi:biopolymer transport protein ExbD
MSTWKVRHEGSPQPVEGLTLEQVVEGLADGVWEPTDEVMGPGETSWVAIESHPRLAEIALDLEPPPPRTYDDETRLDMNPLIDVCLVLLVFFILTTTYSLLSKRLEAPSASKKSDNIVTITKKDIENSMILVKATMENGAPVIRVEDKVVEPGRLVAELRSFVRSTGRNTLILDHDGDVPQETVVKIIDDAKGAGIYKVMQVVP